MFNQRSSNKKITFVPKTMCLLSQKWINFCKTIFCLHFLLRSTILINSKVTQIPNTPIIIIIFRHCYYYTLSPLCSNNRLSYNYTFRMTIERHETQQRNNNASKSVKNWHFIANIRKPLFLSHYSRVSFFPRLYLCMYSL